MNQANIAQQEIAKSMYLVYKNLQNEIDIAETQINSM